MPMTFSRIRSTRDRWIWTVLAVLISSARGVAASPPDEVVFDPGSMRSILLEDWRFRAADPSAGAVLPPLDASWRPVGLADFRQADAGVYWYRTTVRIENRPAAADVLALQFINVPIAFEVYWDGALVGLNGKVGATRETEVPGRFHVMLRLSPELTLPGPHELVLRLSNQRRTPHFQEFALGLGYAADLSAALRDFLDPDLLYVGLYFCGFLFCVVLFFGGGRTRAYLAFGGFIFLAQMVWLVDYVAYTSGLSVSTFGWLGRMAIAASVAAPYVLVLFTAIHFEFRRKWLHLAIPLAALILFELIGLRLRIGGGIVPVGYSMGLVIAAVRRKQPGSAIMLAGFLSSFIRHVFIFLWPLVPAVRAFKPKYLFTIGDGVFLGFVVLSIGMSLREQNRRLEDLRLRSQRLELALLKKSIQPHFLMNTLLSIKSWFAEDPRKAEELVDALAEEFRVISRVSSEKEIAIEEEVRLCRVHLEIMGLRRDAVYSLEVEGLDGARRVPPMIFHTLIENGLTHAYEPGENGRFLLRCEMTEAEVRYTMRNDGSRLGQIASWAKDRLEEGLGLRYIKARLEESYPGRWRVTYGLSGAYFEVAIALKR